jgi:DNA-binding winged helix-turn-helix (wHTH) protein
MNIEMAGAGVLIDRRDEKSQKSFGSEVNLPKRYARFGEFVLDLQRQDLIRNGERARIPGKVFQVLVAMLERPGEIVSREDLRARLWASDTHVNFEANLNTTVNKLRQILGDSNERSVYVQTIPRKGYSFIGEIEFACELEDAVSPEKSPANGQALTSEIPPVSDARSAFFGAGRSQVWFTAGVIALTIAAMMLGAAITLFSYHHS